MKDTVRIVHHGFPGGYVINADEFVAATMTVWGSEAPMPRLPEPMELPKPAPRAKKGKPEPPEPA